MMNVFYGMDIRPCIENTITRTLSRVIGYYSISRGYNQPQTLIEMERKRMKKYKVGIIGATGMVGQRFVLLTAKHPWFEPVVLAASAHSAGKAYKDAVAGKWFMQEDIPESEGNLVVMDAEADAEKIASMVDFVFCAVDMKKDEIKALEEAYAKAGMPRSSPTTPPTAGTPDVPMVVPELNPEHIQVIDAQRKRLGTKRGFIAVKSNCSLQSYVPALHPLLQIRSWTSALVCTYQAISGAGKTFETWPEMVDNVIPYIGGEEEKSEQEPLKHLGPRRERRDRQRRRAAPSPRSACAFRCSDGHMAAVLREVQGRSPPSSRS